MKKIKKLIVTLLTFVLLLNIVKASEYPDVTEDIEIRYKWYKEIITGEYYPIKDVTEKDVVNKNKIQYGLESAWNPIYCTLSSNHYNIMRRMNREYKKVQDARYVLLENFEYNDNIKIYENNKEINFDIINNNEGRLEIDLKKSCMCENLLFFIEGAQNYKISLYTDKKFLKYIISKNINDEKILIPDKTWITEKTEFINFHTEKELEESDLTIKKTENFQCKYREIYVYKYNIEKEYYDDNYHLNVDGYIKDINDYRFFYKGEPIVNTIEITKEKIVKQPQIEYIYIEKENNEIDSSKETNCSPTIKTKTIEKEILKVPKKIYIIIILLIIIIIYLIIKLYKKYVAQRF